MEASTLERKTVTVYGYSNASTLYPRALPTLLAIFIRRQIRAAMLGGIKQALQVLFLICPIRLLQTLQRPQLI